MVSDKKRSFGAVERKYEASRKALVSEYFEIESIQKIAFYDDPSFDELYVLVVDSDEKNAWAEVGGIIEGAGFSGSDTIKCRVNVATVTPDEWTALQMGRIRLQSHWPNVAPRSISREAFLEGKEVSELPRADSKQPPPLILEPWMHKELHATMVLLAESVRHCVEILHTEAKEGRLREALDHLYDGHKAAKEASGNLRILLERLSSQSSTSSD